MPHTLNPIIYTLTALELSLFHKNAWFFLGWPQGFAFPFYMLRHIPLSHIPLRARWNSRLFSKKFRIFRVPVRWGFVATYDLREWSMHLYGIRAALLRTHSHIHCCAVVRHMFLFHIIPVPLANIVNICVHTIETDERNVSLCLNYEVMSQLYIHELCTNYLLVTKLSNYERRQLIQCGSKSITSITQT